MMELAKDFKEHFKDKHITKIATIETSGIAPAVMLGYLLQVPVVYFKKDTSRIMKDDLYLSLIHISQGLVWPVRYWRFPEPALSAF